MLLHLDLATLSPTNGTAVIQVANVLGVRSEGFRIQAGSEPTEVLLGWGDRAYAGDASADQDHVEDQLGDNFWLWRADRVEGGGLTTDGNLHCDIAIVVNGDGVTLYGLAVERG